MPGAVSPQGDGGCSPPGENGSAKWTSTAEVRKYFGFWLAFALILHMLYQAAWIPVFSNHFLHGDSEHCGDVPLVEVGLGVVRLLATAAGARMAFVLAWKQPVRRAEIPAATWTVVVCLQGFAISAVLVRGACLGNAYALLDGGARAAAVATLALGIVTTLCVEASRRRMEHLRAVHRRLRAEKAAQRRARAAVGVRKTCYREARDPTQAQCTMCMADFQDEDTVSRLRCGHLYHTECICVWLIANPHRVCPMRCSSSKNCLIDEWHSTYCSEDSGCIEQSSLAV